MLSSRACCCAVARPAFASGSYDFEPTDRTAYLLSWAREAATAFAGMSFGTASMPQVVAPLATCAGHAGRQMQAKFLGLGVDLPLSQL